MRRAPGNSRHAARALLAAGILACVLLPCLAAPPGPQDPAPRPGGFIRPEPDLIRSNLREILNDPRFARKTTLIEWLLEKLSHWRIPNLSSRASTVLLWILIIWCLLTLAAILGHLIWTLIVTLRRPRPPRAQRLSHYRLAPVPSYEELRARIMEFAARGRFRDAIGLMMLALIRALDCAQILRFHRGKTNLDYLNEVPPQYAPRADFARFVLEFDGTIYGGLPCGRQTYDRMIALFNRIDDSVTRHPKA